MGCRIDFEAVMGEVSEEAWNRIQSLRNKFVEATQKAGLDPNRVIPELTKENASGLAAEMRRIVDQVVDAETRVELIKLSKEVRDEAQTLALADAAKTTSLRGLVAQEVRGPFSLEKMIATARTTWFGQRIQKAFNERFPNWRRDFKSARFQSDLAAEIYAVDRKLSKATDNTGARQAAEIIHGTLNDLRISLALNGDARPSSDALLQIGFDYRSIAANPSSSVDAIAKALADSHGDLAARTVIAQKMVQDIIKGHGHIDRNTFGEIRTIDPSGKTAAVIEWRDAQAFSQINRQYGSKDMLTSLQDQIEFLSRREAIAKSGLSTNKLEQIGRMIGASPNQITDAQAKFRDLTTTRIPDSYLYSKAMSRARSLSTAARLGSAVISALGDLPVMIFVARKNYNVGTFDAITSLFAGAKGREHATYNGAFAEGIVNYFGNRFGTGAEIVSGTFDKVADFTLTASGLNLWTAATKGGFARMLDVKFGKLIRAGITWDQLRVDSPQLFHRLNKFGFGKSDWDSLTIDLLDESGAFDLLRMSGRTQRGVSTRDKMIGFVQSATEEGIITPGFLDRQLIEGNGDSEFRKLIVQFMSFGQTVQRKILVGTITDDLQSVYSRATGLAGLMVSSYLMSMLSVQAREVTAGNQMLAWDSPELAKRAMAQLPIGLVYSLAFETIGEKAFDAITGNERYSNERRAEMLGVVLSTFAAMTEYGIDAVQDGKTGDRGQRRLVNELLRNVPGQSLWWFKAFYRRAVKDMVAERVDPVGYKKAKQAAAKNAREQRVDGKLRNFIGEWTDQAFD